MSERGRRGKVWEVSPGRPDINNRLKALVGIRVGCMFCGHKWLLSGGDAEALLGVKLTMGSVGGLLERLECSECKRRSLTLSELGGRGLILASRRKCCVECGWAIVEQHLETFPWTVYCLLCEIKKSIENNDRGKCRCRSGESETRQNKADGRWWLVCKNEKGCGWKRRL